MPHSTQMNQVTCGNTEFIIDGELSPCLKPAPNVCKGCFLVQYCSRECQQAHWSHHKVDCRSPLMKETWKPSWHLEHRQPSFITNDGSSSWIGQSSHGKQKYMWGNVPAIDVVNHRQNEGANLPEHLNLLFAASGDIRNVVKTLVGLPQSYTGQCDVVINDRDFDIVARNVILLLTPLHFSADEASTIMLHVWYSAFLPKQMFCSLQEKILPLIHQVCAKIQNKPTMSLQSKTWTCGTRSLRLVLQKVMWDRLPSYLQVPDGLSIAKAQDIMTSTTLAPERRDYVDRALYTRPPYWRVCTTRFRKDGMLLPFGQSRREFDTPNPTFYQSSDFWPMMDSADPLEGWAVKEVFRKAPLAKNDIYGSLFIYLRDILLEFCHQLERFKISFQLFQMDAVRLPVILRERSMEESHFDRIEVSNIGDRGFLGPEITLGTFGPLLKSRKCNPNAILLALFLNAVHQVYTPEDSLHSLRSEADRLRQYLPINPEIFLNRDDFNADFMRFNDARSLVRDYDKLFKLFMDECGFEKISKATGLKKKSKNTVIEPWPMRLTKNTTRDEFTILHASGHIGSERYVEWERVPSS